MSLASDTETPADEQSRYVIGIDLGTTNSAMCTVDSRQSGVRLNTFWIPQLVAPHQVESRETLPSFYYQAASHEFPEGALALPWKRDDGTFVGIFAREQGKLVPGRVVESAKSWLSHPGVDRTSPLLPWRAAGDVKQLSPVEVSAAYLSHLAAAWDHAHPHDPFAQQDLVITIPASFDEVARELTVNAARLAGIERVILIEEPQAAFYAWIDAHPDDWNQLVSPGQNILMCDIGGGTSDFTLIRVKSHPVDEVQFHRVAVGDHLILGGDNLDLALAQMVERELTQGGQLEPRQWGTLVRLCRHAKEKLLDANGPASYSITVPGTGRRLLSGGLQYELSQQTTLELLLEGFFPEVPLDSRPRAAKSGFQEFGLPYAADAAITRYLAAFLSDHCHFPEETKVSQRPDFILFNGGVFVSPFIRERVVKLIQHWYSGEEANWQPTVLANERHDLAVARGAAYYGMVRRGQGVRIAAGLPRTYYLGVQSSPSVRATEESAEASSPSLQALCLMPAGAEPGFEADLTAQQFALTVSTPVEFPLFHSSTRLTDPVGQLVEVDPTQLTALPPIRTVLRSRKHKQSATIPVHMHARLTELGTLQLWCSEVEGNRTWQLQFDVRSATQTDRTGHGGSGESAGVLDEATSAACEDLLQATFGAADVRPAGLMKRLSHLLELPREEWPPSLLRRMWETLIDLEACRKRSLEHEARWLNLLGFALRPGFGVALDDWRVAETWKLLRGKLQHGGPTVLAEWWILWRRIAGGLTAGQQQALAGPLLNSLRDEHRKLGLAGGNENRRGKRKPQFNTHEHAEAWRMLASLERLSVSAKVELGTMALTFLNSPLHEPLQPAYLWAIGRLGNRVPLYGPLNAVVGTDVVEEWIDQLLTSAASDAQLSVMLLARRTGDRYRDIGEATRQRVLKWFRQQEASEHFQSLVETGGDLIDREGAMAFGESLPIGIQISS